MTQHDMENEATATIDAPPPAAEKPEKPARKPRAKKAAAAAAPPAEELVEATPVEASAEALAEGAWEAEQTPEKRNPRHTRPPENEDVFSRLVLLHHNVFYPIRRAIAQSGKRAFRA